MHPRRRWRTFGRPRGARAVLHLFFLFFLQPRPQKCIDCNHPSMIFAMSDPGTPDDSAPQCWSSSKPRKYVPRDTAGIVAIKLDLETKGFEFQKWGGTQTCKRNDWLVYNLLDKDTYVIDRDVFKHTYVEQPNEPGRYKRTGTIFAVEAGESGSVKTIEGETAYKKGDYIVSDRLEDGDFYSMEPDKFHKKYVDFNKHSANERENTEKWLQEASQAKEKANKSLKTNRILYWCLQLTSIIAGALVPVLAALGDSREVQIGMSVAGAIATASSAVQSVGRFSENSARDKIIHRNFENLIRDAGSYDAEEIEAKFKQIIWARDSSPRDLEKLVNLMRDMGSHGLAQIVALLMLAILMRQASYLFYF